MKKFPSWTYTGISPEKTYMSDSIFANGQFREW